MFEAFVTYFSQADILFYFLFITAMIMFVIEVFFPSFGVMGIGGFLIAIGAVTERCLHGYNTANEIMLYVLYSIVLLSAAIFIARIIFICIRSRAKTKFKIINGYKVPLKKDGNQDYSFLLGKEGEATSDLKPIGKVRFEEGFFDATSIKEYIYSGTRVKVTKVINQRIFVEKIG